MVSKLRRRLARKSQRAGQFGLDRQRVGKSTGTKRSSSPGIRTGGRRSEPRRSSPSPTRIAFTPRTSPTRSVTIETPKATITRTRSSTRVSRAGRGIGSIQTQRASSFIPKQTVRKARLVEGGRKPLTNPFSSLIGAIENTSIKNAQRKQDLRERRSRGEQVDLFSIDEIFGGGF